MAKFIVTAWEVCERHNWNGIETVSIRIGGDSKFPRKAFEASKLAEVANQFYQALPEFEATGIPGEVFVMCRDGRKPPGFDKATARGGPLNRFIHLEKLPLMA